MSKAHILFENGIIVDVEANLNDFLVMGELVFNTSMTGYQEIITESTYASQILVLTYPLIGNYGIFKEMSESNKVHISALIIKENSEIHIDGVKSLSDYLLENEIPCITGIDTRKLAKEICKNGSQNCLITTEKITDKHIKMLSDYVCPNDLIEKVSTKEIVKYNSLKEIKANIAIIDYGIKNSMISELTNVGANIVLYPHNTDVQNILFENYDAIILSNGPEIHNECDIDNIKKLIGKKDILGIGIGAQILALSVGMKLEKLKQCHRGCNYPIINTLNGKVTITNQNHSYTIDEKTLIESVKITYKNVNDDTIEGFESKKLKIKGILYYPEEKIEKFYTDWIETICKEKQNA